MSRETKFESYLHSGSDIGKLLRILTSFTVDAIPAREVGVVRRLGQLQALLLLRIEAREKTVENVIVPLLTGLRDEARLLEEILLDASALDGPLGVEVNVDVFAETRRVVIANSPEMGNKVGNQWRTSAGQDN